MAISKDEKIAWSNYKSKWISNAKSRDYGHKIRSNSQAILTTSKTIIKDNPRFTVRKNNKIIVIFLMQIYLQNLNSLNPPHKKNRNLYLENLENYHYDFEI